MNLNLISLNVHSLMLCWQMSLGSESFYTPFYSFKKRRNKNIIYMNSAEQQCIVQSALVLIKAAK